MSIFVYFLSIIINRMDRFVDNILEIIQKTVLNPDLTTEILIPFILMIISIIGIEKPDVNLQKQSSKFFSIFNYAIFNQRQFTISAYHELLNTIPHLHSIIGPIDYETRMIIQNIEQSKNLSTNLKIIGKYQTIIDKIFNVVERYLNTSKNHPHIIKSPSVHEFLKDLLFDDKTDFQNVFELSEPKEGGLQKINFYFEYDSNRDLLKIYFKAENSENFLSIDSSEKTFLAEDDKSYQGGKVSQFITNIYNSNIKDDNDDNKDSSSTLNIKGKIKEILTKNKHQLGRTTKIFIGGSGINGCLSILLLLDSEIQNILCQSDITESNVFVFNVGTPSFCDVNIREMFINLNYNYYHIVSMKDIMSFQKIEPWCHLGMPTILGHPKKVNEFFQKFFGEKIKSDIYTEPDKLPKLDYKDEINQSLNNHFHISESYSEYEPNDEDETFLSMPMFTNVSFDPEPDI